MSVTYLNTENSVTCLSEDSKWIMDIVHVCVVTKTDIIQSVLRKKGTGACVTVYVTTRQVYTTQEACAPTCLHVVSVCGFVCACVSPWVLLGPPAEVGVNVKPFDSNVNSLWMGGGDGGWLSSRDDISHLNLHLFTSQVYK